MFGVVRSEEIRHKTEVWGNQSLQLTRIQAPPTAGTVPPLLSQPGWTLPTFCANSSSVTLREQPLLLFPKPFSAPLVLPPLPRHGVYLLSCSSGGLWAAILFTALVQLPQNYQLPLFKGCLPR